MAQSSGCETRVLGVRQEFWVWHRVLGVKQSSGCEADSSGYGTEFWV